MILAEALGVPVEPALPSVLSIDSEDRDRRTLLNILGPSCRMAQAANVMLGLKALRNHRFCAVLCDTDAPHGSWRHVLQAISSLPDSPLLIVTSRLADESLWAEALNLGAWDVLAKPFDEQEVTRVLGAACRQWHARRPAMPLPSQRAHAPAEVSSADLSASAICA